MDLLLKFFGTRLSAILLAVMLSVIFVGGVAYKLDSLSRDKREMELRQSNKTLTENNRRQAEHILTIEAEAKQYADRVSQITAEFEALNRRLSQNVVRRDQSVKEIAPPITSNVDTKDLEQRANGMNVVFDELSRIGKPQ